jgi:hypothetical protein
MIQGKRKYESGDEGIVCWVRIFLSYANEDRAVAEPLALLLRGEGHTVFFDRDDLPGGAEYDVRIRSAVNASDLFLFLISPESVAAGRYTLTELAIVRRRWPHPHDRVLPVMLRPTPLDAVPPYLRAVTIVDPAGNLAAEVGDEVERLRKRRIRHRVLVAAVAAVVFAAVAGAYYAWRTARQVRAIRVGAIVERWKKAPSWESDRYLAKLEIWNGFDVPVNVEELTAEAQSSRYRLESAFDVSGAAFTTAAPDKSTPWSMVLRWVRQEGAASVPVHDGEVPPDTAWRVCWSARDSRNCGEWQRWSPRGTFEQNAVTELPPAIRTKVRAVAWNGDRFVVALADGTVALADTKLQFGRVGRVTGTPIALALSPVAIAVATRAPDGVTVLEGGTLTRLWNRSIPRGTVTEFGETKPMSTEPQSLAFDGQRAWITTSRSGGAAAMYELTREIARRLSPRLDMASIEDLRLQFANRHLYATTPSLTPHYIYQLDVPVTYSGHDSDDVSRIADFVAVPGVPGSYYATCAGIQLCQFHFDGRRFVVDQRLDAPPGLEPAWDVNALAVDRGVITTGFIRLIGDEWESRILQRSAKGVWNTLLTVPRMRVEQMASGRGVTLAVLSDGKGSFETFAFHSSQEN